MSLNKDIFRKRPILGNRILTSSSVSYYPQDFDDIPAEYREGSARYSSWKRFKEEYPKNAELLVHLFGERDAIECHRHMVVVSEIKAASLCAHFPTAPSKRNRLGPVE